jgi:hypothetical protein
MVVDRFGGNIQPEGGSMDERIRIQRATGDEHIRAENAHNWPVVYGTFVQDENSAFTTSFPCIATLPA